MAISRSQLVKELEPGLNALFGLEYKRYENQHAEIYTTETSDRALLLHQLNKKVLELCLIKQMKLSLLDTTTKQSR